MKQVGAWIIGVMLAVGLTAIFADTTGQNTPETNAASAQSPSNSPDSQMWNLQDADIRAVIQTISQMTKKNFIIDPRVQGKITIISSKPMSADELYQVFLSMLQILNYAAIPSNNIIKIVPAMQAKEFGGTLLTSGHEGTGDEIVVRVIPVENIPASQLIPILRPMMQEWGTVNAYDPSNTLIMAGTASNVAQLVQIVHDLDEKSAHPVTTVQLKYSSAKKLTTTITNLQNAERSQGKVSNYTIAADEENNTILVSGSSSNREQVIDLIHKLDKPNGSIGDGATTAVIHLSYLNAKKFAPVLMKIAKDKIKQQKQQPQNMNPYVAPQFQVQPDQEIPISIQPESDNNALIVSAPAAMLQTLKGIIKLLDVRPDQVLVQAIIVRVNESVANTLGIQWGMANSGNPNNQGVNSAGVQPSIAFDSGVGFIPHGNIRALLTALNTHNSTDILATPSIVMLNNYQATISDGQNIGILNRQYAGTAPANQDQASVYPYNTFERRDVTLSLKVTPQITPDRTVRLKIEQQDQSIITGVSTIPGNPDFNTSTIKTNVLVNSGDILVLGGLISNDNRISVEKIPILGDIPILGGLFRYKNKESEKKNLMVFIRPVILHNHKQGDVQTHKRYDYMRDQQFRARSGIGLDLQNPSSLPVVDRDHLVKLPPPLTD